MKLYTTLLVTLSAAFILSSCSVNPMQSKKDAECNELKSRMIFNGATGNTRRSEIQRAEAPLVQRNYDKSCT